ncbi:hypothetical protein QYE76_014781 [Lolium multiflorum]|uniref:Uncharacterized protein n=1 Tax=Lolium multiflorum TaxID=4521 RepID=A0AAD8U6V5_LOLMU|nr:hypothetical protein QYE76_014781 [Lolium multiflorum]
MAGPSGRRDGRGHGPERPRGRGRGRRGRAATAPRSPSPAPSSSSQEDRCFEFLLRIDNEPLGIKRLRTSSPSSSMASSGACTGGHRNLVDCRGLVRRVGQDVPHTGWDKYEEGASIARGVEEQLDVKLDMELDMKTSHGHAREDREACAREEEEAVQAGARPGPTAATPPTRSQPGPTGTHAGEPVPTDRAPVPTGCVVCHLGAPVMTRSQARSKPDRPVPGPVDRPPRRLSPSLDEKIVNQENKDVADVMTWREYEPLRNEMRREFRTQDEELKGTIQEMSQKLDTTNETITNMQDQMTDIQRSLQILTIVVDNLTQQQQQEDEDPELQDEARGVGRGVGCGNRGRGFVELRARCVPPTQQDNGLGKPKFSIPKFEGGADVEEYLTWELKIEKLWHLHD